VESTAGFPFALVITTHVASFAVFQTSQKLYIPSKCGVAVTGLVERFQRLTKFEFKAIIEFSNPKLAACGFPPKTLENKKRLG